MHREEPQPKGWTPIQDAKAAANFLMLAAQSLAAPLEPFLRHRFGPRYFGVPSTIGLFIIPMWMLLWPDEDPRPIMGFWLLFILVQLIARIECVGLAARGHLIHTRYNGHPRLAAIFRKVPERTLKSTHEPWLAIFAGVLALTFSAPLGSYLIAAGVCLAVCASVGEAVDRARALQLHDAWIEQQILAERFREMQRRGGR